MGGEPVLELVDVTKTFPGARALKGVSLTVQPGEVHALVGENGAGKSTLIKIATGAQGPDSGTMRVAGEEVSSFSRRAVQALGIRAIFQERQVAADLTVAENVLLDRLPTRLGLVNWRAAHHQARERLARLGIDIDPAKPVRELSVAELQLVEIARAVSFDARLVVMDEPTASLHRQEVQNLFAVVRALKQAGVAVLYISHHLDEIFAIADTVTVLRDGVLVGTAAVSEVRTDDVVSMMFGRTIEDRAQADAAGELGEPVLVVHDLHVGGAVHGVSFEVAQGEILAVTGGLGAGTSELARALVGATKPTAGSVSVNGAPLRSRSAAADTVGFLPADRKRLGLLLDQTVADNVILGRMATKGSWLVRPRWVRSHSEELRTAANVKAASVDVGVRTLSGGNQQKVIIGRWLAVGSKVLVFDEPTAGIDISSKFEIYETLRRLADEGAAIVVCTTDFQEVRQVADRVLVLRDGRVVGEAPGAEATEHRLIELEMSS